MIRVLGAQPDRNTSAMHRLEAGATPVFIGWTPVPHGGSAFFNGPLEEECHEQDLG